MATAINTATHTAALVQAIDQMLKEIEDISELSDHMAQLSTASKEILDELFHSSRDSQETVKNISEQVTETNNSVQQIRSVTEYIISIADETNLLALNASESISPHPHEFPP